MIYVLFSFSSNSGGLSVRGFSFDFLSFVLHSAHTHTFTLFIGFSVKMKKKTLKHPLKKTKMRNYTKHI